MTLHTTHQKTIKKPINSTQSLKLSSFRSAIHFGFKQIFLQRYQPKGSTDSASSSSKSPPKLDMAWSCSPHKSHFAQSFFLELWASWATHMKILELRKLGALWLGFFKECFEVLYGVMIWRCRKQLRGQQTWEKNTVLRLFGLRKESLYVDSILKISGHLIYLTWLEDLYTYVTMCIYFRKRFPAGPAILVYWRRIFFSGSQHQRHPKKSREEMVNTLLEHHKLLEHDVETQPYLFTQSSKYLVSRCLDPQTPPEKAFGGSKYLITRYL